jgi:hypothetical protein
LALAKAPSIGFSKYIVSATTPFDPSDVVELALDAPSVVRAPSPTSRPNTSAVTGGYSQCSIVSMTTVGREENWTGHPSTTFDTCLIASSAMTKPEAFCLGRLVPRDTTTRQPGYTRFAELSTPHDPNSIVRSIPLADLVSP